MFKHKWHNYTKDSCSWQMTYLLEICMNMNSQYLDLVYNVLPSSTFILELYLWWQFNFFLQQAHTTSCSEGALPLFSILSVICLCLLSRWSLLWRCGGSRRRRCVRRLQRARTPPCVMLPQQNRLIIHKFANLC